MTALLITSAAIGSFILGTEWHTWFRDTTKIKWWLKNRKKDGEKLLKNKELKSIGSGVVLESTDFLEKYIEWHKEIYPILEASIKPSCLMRINYLNILEGCEIQKLYESFTEKIHSPGNLGDVIQVTSGPRLEKNFDLREYLKGDLECLEWNIKNIKSFWVSDNFKRDWVNE